MNTNRSETNLDGTKLRSQINAFQSELETIRSKVQRLTDENDSLRNELRRTKEEKSSGNYPDNLSNLNNNPIIEIQKQKIEALEMERNNALRLYEESKQQIFQLETENNDLKDPLKPYLMKSDMQAKQAQEEHARAEVQLAQEIHMIREELLKRSRELTNSQLRVKELERQNEHLQADVYRIQDDLRNHLKKENGYDGTFVAFQSSIDALEVRLEHAVREKENAKQQRDDMEIKVKNLSQQNQSLEEKLNDTIEQLQHQVHFQTTIDQTNDTVGHDQQNHERMHRTINELIEQAAVKTRTAVEEVRQQYNENLERIMQEYNNMEAELNKKQNELDKCLRSKRSIEEELNKILQERRFNLEKSTMDNEDYAKRCFHAERERDENQLKLEQIHQSYKLLQQSFEAEKANHELKQKELTDRFQKVNNDLEKMTRDYTTTFTELNELKKRLSSTQNEQILLQRRITELIKRHEEQILEKETDCLARLKQRDDVNRTTFNELRNLVNRQQRMIVKYKEECHTIASQSETKINELKQKIDNLRGRNEQLQSEIGDVKRKEAETERLLIKNTNRIKTLEERLHDTEEQAIEASRRAAKQLVRDRLGITQGDHYSYSTFRPNHSASLFNLTTFSPPIAPPTESIEHISNDK
ncbi:hypothetical protein I4U23_018302 [Adineta vaga]|nr:hypothetical protein I4U23_018302 [Adineta vaga]